MTHEHTHEVDVLMANRWQKEDKAVLVDVREQAEHKYERIEGSLLMPISLFEPALLPKEGKLIFYCQFDGRSKEAVRRFLAFGGKEGYSLKGGLEAWKGASLPTIGEKDAIQEIPSRAKVILGILIAAGSILTLFHSSVFLLLPLAVAAALIYDGWKDNHWISKNYIRLFSRKK
jgi:rhodanese-related sulfurtransferase